MNRLVALAMVITLATLVAQLLGDGTSNAVAALSLVFAAGAIGLAAARTVRNALQLASQEDSPDGQSELARRILGDHVLCLVAITAALVLQVTLA
jgi:hypothetical protein